MKSKWIIIGVVCLLLLVVIFALIGPIMSNVEHPKYKVISSIGNIELRQYSPMIIAEVEVQGERKQAINDGFRLLADYIFGNNTLQDKIAMTAPVQQQNNAKIAMTAPVQQQENQGSWKISFVMPSQYNMQTIPKPNNDRIILKEIPERNYVVIRFSGESSNENIDKHKMQLMQYIKENNIQTVENLKYAFYNPPWTLPFMRRNEIMMQIKT